MDPQEEEMPVKAGTYVTLSGHYHQSYFRDVSESL